MRVEDRLSLNFISDFSLRLALSHAPKQLVSQHADGKAVVVLVLDRGSGLGVNPLLRGDALPCAQYRYIVFLCRIAGIDGGAH